MPPETEGAIVEPAPALTQEPTPTPFDEKSLPPEAQAYLTQTKASLQKEYEGRYVGYDDYKKKASNFDAIVQRPSFNKWYQDEVSPPAPQAKSPEEMSDEQFAAILSNKKEMSAYLNTQIEKRAQELMGPELKQNSAEVQLMKRKGEIESFAFQNRDFWELDEKNLIAPILNRYRQMGLPNVPIADVYKLAKFDLLRKEAIDKAHGIVDGKRTAVTEKPGLPSALSGGKIKVKSTEEAMTLAYQAAKAGRETPEMEFAK